MGLLSGLLVHRPRAALAKARWPWAAIGRTFGAEILAAMRTKNGLNRVPFMPGMFFIRRLADDRARIMPQSVAVKGPLPRMRLRPPDQERASG